MDNRKIVRLIVLFFVVGLVCASTVHAQARFPYSVASGDPRPDSVVLWTKVHDPDMPDALRVEVATDTTFGNIVATRDLVAEELYDYAVKVMIDGLQPYTTYFYRFIYGSGAAIETSPVGRTRTAPAPGTEQPVRFAVIYCQDYIGSYYNSLAKLLRDDEDIDFVVHLGDYIYETTGDPSFQDPGFDRKIEFSDLDGAIELGSGEDAYHAAASLSNYREIYAASRMDIMLRQVHERWPMIVIWDDHEFSDDSWGANGTYFDDMRDEYDPDRRRNAEQAFFEWTPSAAGLNDDGVLEIDNSVLYPNSVIYRDFHFGSLLHLVMTDYRTYRPDHIVPEGAFPGTMVLDQDALVAALSEPVFEAVKGSFDPYVNIDSFAGFPIFRQTLALISAQAYLMENPDLDFMAAIRLAESKLNGNISVTFINLLFDAAGLPHIFDQAAIDQMPRGLSYLYVGKQTMYGSTGSRYLLINDSFNLLAGVMALTTAGQAQNAFGDLQMAWLQGVVSQSTATWTVLGSSVSMAPMVLDFTNPLITPNLPPDFPDVLRTRLKLNVDQWDGFPDARAALLDLMRLTENPIIISGDIHATFVTDHGGVFEFTPPAVSSSTFGSMVTRMVSNNPLLGNLPGMEQLIAYLPLFLQISAQDDVMVSPSDLLYAATTNNGYGIFDVTADAFNVSLMEIPESERAISHYDNPEALDDLFTESAWVVQDGQLMPVP